MSNLLMIERAITGRNMKDVKNTMNYFSFRCVDAVKENSDPFYSEINQSHLMKAIQQLKEGKGVAHELIEE